jgi:hypothetical protein
MTVSAMVIAATAAGGAVTDVRAWVYRVAAALLVAVGVLTALTCARTPVVWFNVCLTVMRDQEGNEFCVEPGLVGR